MSGKVIGYVRVSTAQQAQEGVSLEAQRERIRRWVALHDGELVRIYADEGRSGKRADNRPGLQSAMTEAMRLKATLVCYSLSRFARSAKDALNLTDQLRRSGATLASITEQFDTSTAYGKMLYTVLAAVAQMESDLASERTRMVKEHQRRQGKRISGILPIGFRLGPDGKALIEDPEEQRAVEVIRTSLHRGRSLRKTQSDLLAAGVLGRFGKPISLNGIKSVRSRLSRAA